MGYIIPKGEEIMALGTRAGWAVFTNMFSYQTELPDMSQCPLQLSWPWPTEVEQK